MDLATSDSLYCTAFARAPYKSPHFGSDSLYASETGLRSEKESDVVSDWPIPFAGLRSTSSSISNSTYSLATVALQVDHHNGEHTIKPKSVPHRF